MIYDIHIHKQGKTFLPQVAQSTKLYYILYINNFVAVYIFIKTIYSRFV